MSGTRSSASRMPVPSPEPRPSSAAPDDGRAASLASVLASVGLTHGAALASATDPGPTNEAMRWAASGGMHLTGPADGPPVVPRAPVMTRWDAAGSAVQAMSTALGRPVPAPDPIYMVGRAALRGLSRRGRTSAGGSCRLLRCRDGWVAVNLPRDVDREAVAAIVEASAARRPWRQLADAAAVRSREDVEARCRLLDVPVAALPPRPHRAPAPLTVTRHGAPSPVRPIATGLLVVDLSAMWAGPLCAHLLGQTGACVVKVESTARPDGARADRSGFFDWLHAGQSSVALDLTRPDGRRQLRRLVAAADVVIEASRPRALRRLGVKAAEVLAAAPGRVWVSITGHGRDGPGADRVAFGDDAAVAGGLVAADSEGRPVFCSDAIADPLTGLYATAAALAGLLEGGGLLVDVTMREVAAHVAAGPSAPRPTVERIASGGWRVRQPAGAQPVIAPRRPAVVGRAEPMGASTAEVLHWLATG